MKPKKAPLSISPRRGCRATTCPGKWTVVVLLGLLGFSPLSSNALDNWQRLSPPLSFDFPRDHGAHPEFKTEWWYCTGIARDPEGREFGLQITFFRVGLDPSVPAPRESTLRARQVLVGHLAIADVEGEQFRKAERIGRSTGGLAGAATQDLSVWIGDWEMKRRADGTLRMNAFDVVEAIGLDVTLAPLKPILLQGDGGYSSKGSEPGNASAYLTWPRLALVGTLSFDGRELQVEGEGWVDHEYGTSQLGEGVVGWDWFGLRLADNRELTLYRLRREDGSAIPQSSGSLMEADGTTRSLGSEDFSMEVLSTWKSPETGAEYPAKWRLSVPSAGIEIFASPLLESCEMNDLAATGIVYWEGPYRLEGTVSGEGYGEFTGYAGSVEGRF